MLDTHINEYSNIRFDVTISSIFNAAFLFLMAIHVTLYKNKVALHEYICTLVSFIYFKMGREKWCDTFKI